MSYTSRFVNEDQHFAEVPGCPLRGVRMGASPSSLPSSEAACARCVYNVAFVGSPQIGCHVRTPADVVTRARAAAGDTLAARFTALRAAEVDGPAWQAFGTQLLAVDDDDAREVASVILRFVSASEPVEILR